MKRKRPAAKDRPDNAKDRSPGTEDRPDNAKALWVYTPSRSRPEDLEFILVQRQKILQDAVERVRESVLTAHKHHLLFVGPRGCGKTHLVTLIVSRLSADQSLADHLRLAWLNEDETSTTVLELLLKIHAALEKRYPAEYRPEALDTAYDMRPDEAQEFVGRQLLASLGSRTLVVVAENLDAIFDGLGAAGQQELRAFIQENPRLSLVATAQRLVDDLSDRASPFFGFFQTEHLKPLNIDEATALLQNIAKLRGKADVVEFLATSRGRSRVRALHHLSGGNHRIYIVLSQFITRDSIDALVGPFMKMVDELTPYYQERVRWLPPLQRKIVEYLCSCEGTAPVKDIAKKLFATPPTISSQLQLLREKGYVEASARGRESLYEVSEPLMRICVEVKENQSHQPLRLLVDFLRVWYDDADMSQRLGRMARASASRTYLEAALQKNQAEGNLRTRLLVEELGIGFPQLTPPGFMAEFSKQCPECFLLGMQCIEEGNTIEGIKYLTEVIEQSGAPTEIISGALLLRALGYDTIGDVAKSIGDLTRVIELPGAPVDQVALALINRGAKRSEQGVQTAAIADFTRVIELSGVPIPQLAKALYNRGVVHAQEGDTLSEIADYTRVIELPGAPSYELTGALVDRGFELARRGDMVAAIVDFTRVIESQGSPAGQVAMALLNRGFARRRQGDRMAAIDDYTRAIELPGAAPEAIARALVGRASALSQEGDRTAAISDYTRAIELPGIPAELLIKVRYLRGAAYYLLNCNKEAQTDFEANVHLPNQPAKIVVDSYSILSQIHWSEGRWTDGFAALEAGLQRGASEKPPYFVNSADLVAVLFSAGLNPEGRLAKVASLLQLYGKYDALSILGGVIILHIGQVFRAGEPLPSTDNLEQWVAVWEEAAAGVPAFSLPCRLLRTAVDFIKAGGKDPGILLTLTSAEREILRQALGLTEKSP